jgi:diacylglycerol kinase family enzyme
MEIVSDPPQRVIGDGEEWGQSPISVKVLPSAVRFMVPDESADKKS